MTSSLMVQALELKAGRDRCEEASPLSREKYIPCNAPATQVVDTGGLEGTYRMCDPCASHNINNRGMRYIGAYKPEVGL